MSTCPSCGRPVEGGNTCPRCGASLHLRLPLQILRYGALLVAVGGLLALFYAARRTSIPHVDIGDLGAAQNLAYVEISGTVTQPPRYDPTAQSLSFRLEDGTGEALVSAPRTETAALVEAGRVPAVGDHVTVQGTLRVREDFTSLTLNAADTLALQRPPPTALVIGAISPDFANQPVEVTAQVVGTRQPYPGLSLITLQDPTGQIDAALDQTTRLLTGDPPRLAPGDVVRLSGVITLFQDRPRLSLISSQGVEVLPPGTPLEINASAPETSSPVASLRVGTVAKVEGVVTAVESYASGFKFVLDDGSGSLTLVLRDEVYHDVAGREGLRAGARVAAWGLVEIFDGELEIAPATAGDLIVRQPGSSVDAITTVNHVGLAQVGQRVTVSGRVTKINPFDQGTRLIVADSTGTISVLLWENVLAYVPGAEQLTVGQSATVTGRVDQFQGTLEVVPQIGPDVILH